MYSSARLVSGSAQTPNFLDTKFLAKTEKLCVTMTDKENWHSHCQRGKQNKKGR